MKSSSQPQMLQVLRMLVNFHFKFGIDEPDFLFNILVLLSDPEFVLEGIPFTVLFPKLFKYVVFGIPPFHTQKHCMESLCTQPCFLRVIKNSLARALQFKPSVNLSLHEDIDDFILDLLHEQIEEKKISS